MDKELTRAKIRLSNTLETIYKQASTYLADTEFDPPRSAINVLESIVKLSQDILGLEEQATNLDEKPAALISCTASYNKETSGYIVAVIRKRDNRPPFILYRSVPRDNLLETSLDAIYEALNHLNTYGSLQSRLSIQPVILEVHTTNILAQELLMGLTDIPQDNPSLLANITGIKDVIKDLESNNYHIKIFYYPTNSTQDLRIANKKLMS